MPKDASSFDLTLTGPPQRRAMTRWLSDELRNAILQGRIRPGTRLPATRDFARQYGVARGTVVNVFEQLQVEGYLRSRTGAGTWVNERLPNGNLRASRRSLLPAMVRPEPMTGLNCNGPARPFRVYQPAIEHFPVKVWTQLARRRLAAFSSWLQAEHDAGGFAPLREAIADYLGSSRGVRCVPGQIMIVSGIQQGLDLLARLLVKRGDPVWMEDPGYFGAIMAFRNAGARIIAVPLDEEGLSVSAGMQLCARARAVYLTPAHQFPLGMTMSLDRRLAVLDWANRTGAVVIEDDYDSEYRFETRPVPALQGLDASSNVALVGTFNKVLFPWLRLGYIVLPLALVEPFLALRYATEFRCAGLDQAILCDFIADGHFGRHIRRMRELYAARLAALLYESRRYLSGLLEVSPVQAGLYSVAFLRNGMTSREAEDAAAIDGVETMGFHRLTLARPDLRALVLGFAAFDETSIRNGVICLAKALERSPRGRRHR
jgi:GntR family transcriptional regulator / MocR family aminotransferase